MTESEVRRSRVLREAAPRQSRRLGRAFSRRPDSPLADVIRALHACQSVIDRRARQAARVLLRLERANIHEQVGYASSIELAESLLRECPLLAVVLDLEARPRRCSDIPPRLLPQSIPEPSLLRLEPIPGSAPLSSFDLPVSEVPGTSPTFRPPSDSLPPRPSVRVLLCRQTSQSASAFGRLAVARLRLRELDLGAASACARARLLLARIERQRLFAECSYPSFEEFLLRGVGPNPVFASLLMAPLPVAEPSSKRQEASATDDPPSTSKTRVASRD